MSQTFLDENPPMILDATCSDKRIWPKKATVRMDIKAEVRPELQADFRRLPFKAHSITKIYWDPPHRIRYDRDEWAKVEPETKYQGYVHHARFSAWRNRQEWLAAIQDVNAEFYRVLTNDGQLRIKALDGPGKVIKLADLEGLTNFLLVDDYPRPSRYSWSNNTVHWLTMRPKP